jgi:hypothetical protein
LKNIRRSKVYVNPTELDGIPHFWSAWVLERRREARPVKSCGMVDNVYQVSIAKVHNICKKKVIKTLVFPLHRYREVERLNCISLTRVACPGNGIQLVLGICWQVLKTCFLQRLDDRLRRLVSVGAMEIAQFGLSEESFCSIIPSNYASPMSVYMKRMRPDRILATPGFVTVMRPQRTSPCQHIIAETV